MEPLESKAPHVLIFPFPAQGHVNSMLNLAQLLSLAGLNITFLNTDHNHNRLVLHSNILHRFACFPGFQFKSIPDGLPDDHPRAGVRFREMFDSFELVTIPLFREMLCSGQLNTATGRSVTCIIADGILSFPIDVGNELGIPVIHFRTGSACYFLACFCIQDMIEAGELPIRENEVMDRLIRSVPGMETFLRIRDLPSFCQASNLADPNLQLVANKTRQSLRAHALILNTFEDLEGPVLSHIRARCPKIYTIGPLHAILKSKLESKTTLLQSRSPNSLFEVDRSCMVWLDAQPLKSVIYVSFGSITIMTKDKLMEFWYGLVNSKKRFLWAIRPDLVIQKDGEGQIPVELVEGTKDRGYMVGWVPQEEVLVHQAVGGFLTHSGWNSTLESIVAGVPMICWPFFADQQINSRFVSEVWKLGMDMKDVCDRVMVEKMVNHLMEETREIFMKSTAEKARLAKESVSEGGSSYRNLDHLIKDIRLMSMATTK
ncbi:7-deoxyloganetic acid glucosyltransferase-like [Quercus robur]|uniref:7-deoxyloganetic acid glucosyltransferase-like n=1 Tax=Quercus robur TaxID=38942 RepID=UPI002161B978|nr:7-deoxyloganetic acid glucosyltransferase-like [Quercus robur]